MDIIRRSQFQTVPWNNGGGITHEVAREDQEGKLLWRLSLAEVGRDGPFSLFPGLARILTVIDGPGMDLISPRGTLMHELPLLRPVYFSGDEELAGRLRNGPCLDFNLIYDPRLYTGAAIVLTNREQLVPTRADIEGVLCLEGTITWAHDTLQRHDFAFVTTADPPLRINPDSKALRLTLSAR